jgi:hypothetical protein
MSDCNNLTSEQAYFYGRSDRSNSFCSQTTESSDTDESYVNEDDFSCCSKVSEAFNRYRDEIGLVNTVGLGCLLAGLGFCAAGIFTSGFGFIPGIVLLIIGTFILVANILANLIYDCCCTDDDNIGDYLNGFHQLSPLSE